MTIAKSLFPLGLAEGIGRECQRPAFLVGRLEQVSMLPMVDETLTRDL